MTKKNQTGNPANENFIGESGSTWINEIYGDAKNLKGNAIGGNDTITGGNDGAKNHLYGDAHSLKENAKGGVDTITGGSNGSTNYIYGDAYSMECNAKGAVDTITGGAFGATNYIYGDAYRMKGNVQGGNDILVGGLNAKNFIYGDSFAMSNGAKAGDDAISLANASTLVLDAIYDSEFEGATKKLMPTSSTSIQNNILIGDAESILNSSSGSDSINVGNNSTAQIQDVSLNSYYGSDIQVSSTVSLDISKNSLIGDAKNLKNSSSGDDIVSVGKYIENKLDKILVNSYFPNTDTSPSSNSKASASSTISINLSSNRLIGDAENITSSSAGYDSLSVGDNLKITMGDVSLASFQGGTSVSNILLNFKFLDNILLGDAETMKNSSAGNDAISVGNNMQNTMANLGINVNWDNSEISFSKPIISFNELVDFTLSANELIGDAATIVSSAAGEDILEIGNNFKNSFGVTNRFYQNGLLVDVSESVSFSVTNNRLFGDAKNMSYSSGGKDTIGVGNNAKNFISELTGGPSTSGGSAKILASMSYFISDNTFIGDALNIKNSSAGDDNIAVSNEIGNVFEGIKNAAIEERTSKVSSNLNFKISNNSLMGDAENMKNSRSGNDVITVGNKFTSEIRAVKNEVYGNNGIADTKINLNSFFSKNILIGDAKTMQDSTGGNDNLVVGNDINTTVQEITNITSAGFMNSEIKVNFFLAENILFGDAENMSKSASGRDTIELGNNFKNNFGEIISNAYFGSSLKSLSIIKFSLSDNALYGDAKVMSHASGGDDQIIVGNSIRNEIGNIKNFSIDGSSASTILESDFSLLKNILIGDAKNMNHSQGGNDVISLGNDFKSNVGTITSTVDNTSTATATISVIYALEDNNLYGDAETMSYSKGGNDTLSIGVGIEGDSHLTLDIKNNTLYGDANTMQRSQGGDDKLTGADGEGSVTYLYGDAKFTDGKSGAGNDTLTSGHGNDHMWGDFGGNINQNVPYVNYSSGKDIFVFGENNGNDIIYDFQQGLDKIDLRSLVDIDNINDLTITSSLTQPSDKVINLSDGNSITLIGVNELSANDFMFAAVV